MIAKKFRLVLSITFFTVWLVILWAGADHPPPVGFLWLILFDGVAAGLVYIRVPTYLNWLATRKKNRLPRVLADGMVAGFSFAIVAMLINPTGEPTIGPPTWLDILIWFAVLGAVGAINALLVYLSCYAAGQIYKNPDKKGGNKTYET